MKKTYKVEVDERGDWRWYNEAGKLHRENGPAVEYADGEKRWYRNGKLHREDGPAIEFNSGTKCWYRNGKLHREDGPAIEYADGSKFWYNEGKEFTEAEFNKRTGKSPSCVGKVVEIDGRKYKLVEV